MPQITRRRFVAGVGAGVIAGSWRGLPAAQDHKIVVVGAGLAGLAATHDLVEAGADVTLIEASHRAGGRVRTVRDHFADGAWVDVGGQSTGAMYGNFAHYATKLGLKFAQPERPAERPDVLLHLRGTLFSAAELRQDPSRWPVDIADTERPLAPSRLLGHYLDPIAKEIRTVDKVLAPEFIAYDKLTLRELLQQRGASAAAIALIDHTLNYNSVDTVSALSALRDRVRALVLRGGQAMHLENGNQSLPDAFAEYLGETIRFGHTLTALQHGPDGLQLQIETKGGTETLYADKVIVAIPFTALRKVKFEPGLPAARQQIVDELPYTQIVQTYLQTKTRFWEQGSPVAMVMSDGPLERLFSLSNQMKGDRGLIVNWVNGTGTQHVASQDPDEQVSKVIGHLEGVWPGCRNEVDVTLAHNWSKSYARGAYAHYAPGQMAAFAADIHKPVGRIHFAGEHTELVAPGMEGALRSGQRAAKEVLEALNYT